MQQVVVDTTKVRIFKQITTQMKIVKFLFVLLLIPQRYEFSSKSQRAGTGSGFNKVVVDTTKVRIFKQITTNSVQCKCYTLLLLIPQRYEFSSKSQLVLVNLLVHVRCC